jgi:hypothetical protein
MKPTDTNLAIFYGTDRKTIGSYRKSDKKGVLRKYEAMRDYFIKWNI